MGGAIVPREYALLSMEGKTILKANVAGVHVATVAANGPAPKTFAIGACPSDATAWADEVPMWSTVTVAVIDPDGSSADILAALAGAGLGCPSGALPTGCSVAAAVGRKGQKEWSSTSAAPDITSASGPIHGDEK